MVQDFVHQQYVVVCCLAFSVRAKKLPELQVWRGNWQTWRCWVLRGGEVVHVGGIRQLWLWLDEWSCKFNLRLTKFCKTILLHVDVICSRLKLVTVFLNTWECVVSGNHDYAQERFCYTSMGVKYIDLPLRWGLWSLTTKTYKNLVHQRWNLEIYVWDVDFQKAIANWCKSMGILWKKWLQNTELQHTHTHADTPKMCF